MKTTSRPFRYKGQGQGQEKQYTLTLYPARFVNKDGEEIEHFPTRREELVEAALRKLACDQNMGLYLDDRAGVRFTLRQLQREMRQRGHAIHLNNLLEALHICSGTTLELTQMGEKKPSIRAPIFPTLMLNDRDDWRQNPDAKCYVQFNPLVTASIDALTYRQFDYETYMELNQQLARWLFKRLSHNFTQASLDMPYTISAQRIINDSHLADYDRLRDQIKAIDQAMEELQANSIISKIERDVRREQRRVRDIVYTLTPSPLFSDEVKHANYRSKHLRLAADGQLEETVAPARELA